MGSIFYYLYIAFGEAESSTLLWQNNLQAATPMSLPVFRPIRHHVPIIYET